MDLYDSSIFHELMKDDIEEISDENMCLISHDRLDENHITLPCNHSFNYYPLYLEIWNQKKKKNYIEIVRLRQNQIKCPYCRTVHNFLIPYVKMENVDIVWGVNSPKKYVYYPNKCCYVYKRGGKKGKTCGLRCIDKFCNNHIKYQNNNTVGPTEIVKNEIISDLTCKYIFKRGKNKGNTCGKTLKNIDCVFCTQHSK